MPRGTVHCSVPDPISRKERTSPARTLAAAQRQPDRPPSRSRWRAFLAVTLLGVLIIRLFDPIESFAFYFPSREPFDNPRGVTDVWFTGKSGGKLHGWLLLPRESEGPPPAVLHVHGNAGNVSSHLDFSRFLVDRGFAVFIFDYRGYGRSDPAASGLSRAALMDDTRAALNALLARPEIDPTRVAVYGVSIGNAFSTRLAAERPEIRAVVAAAPFSGWRRIAHTHAPLLGAALIRGGMDPIDSCTALGRRPLLLIHGQEDTIVPPAESARIERVAAKAGVAVTRLVVPGVGHNDIVYASHTTKEAMVAFLERALAKP